MKKQSIIGLFALLLVFGACDTLDDNKTALQSAEVNQEVDKRAPAPGGQTIAEIVVASTQADPAEFTLLFDALEYAGLTGVFTGGGQYTVFAPTDEAFVNLVVAVGGLLDPDVLANEGPFAAIDALLGEGTVFNVLLYHVTNGRRAANSVVPPRNNRKIQTLLEGASFTVNSAFEITAVGNSANIVAADISASNGIIHVIDAVILPIDLGL